MITENHQLKARKVYFDFSESTVCWMPNDPLCSHVANGINMLLPAGEFWFCRVFNKAIPYVTDEKLKQEVIGFVRQEAAHARAHEKAQDFLRENGYDIQDPLNRAHVIFNILLGDKPLGIPFLKGEKLDEYWLLFRVGVIAAIEHFTGIIGQWTLDSKSWDTADPAMTDLFRWHLAEEVEHRCVAYDLFEHLLTNKFGFYISRQVIMMGVFPLFIYFLADFARSLAQQDLEHKDIQKLMRRGFFNFIREFEKTATQTDNLPTIKYLWKATLRWASPKFNPVHEGDTEQALAYMARSPAVQYFEQMTQNSGKTPVVS
ncbi:metal-dependent hydrolase [Acinetobacter genomosp. 15BJ]|uniref:Metal-dependent hydrolase n=2 Tax=Acinetobacter genomosp. 15BJ TaxID=106651 RepID=A0ABT8UVG4_9GAMM|nr:metal-dependent hydrolase [Acinetobacter genomosp. 15BJ]MCH7290516.1 metal-dependent hydrolase [Acinetobacter genomosp. 15BJ]MDO3657027.1 metal-dependent hydrolase [Acinetobacter genomosp. 15BJ]